MIKKTILYLLVLLQLSFSTLHEYYVSLTEINYNPDKERLEIISRLFHDDFEKVLQERYYKNIELKPSVQSDGVEEFIKKYFDKKLTLNFSEKNLKLDYLGYEFDEDRINIYLKVDQINDFKSLTVNNLLLTDVIEDQKNIVHCFKPNQKKSVVLTRYNAEALLKFND